MTGRAWAVATVVTIVSAAGIGTATAGKLPPAVGGAPLTQSAVEDVLAGGTLDGSLTATQTADNYSVFVAKDNAAEGGDTEFDVGGSDRVTTGWDIIPESDGAASFGQWDKRFTNGGFKRALQGEWETLTFADDGGTTVYTTQPTHSTMLVECTHASGCTWDMAATPVGLVTTIFVDSGSNTLTLEDTATHFVGGAGSLALSACDVVTLRNDGGSQEWYQTTAVLSLSTCPDTI